MLLGHIYTLNAILYIRRILMKKQKVMKCPTCNETLLMSEKNGIEIDYCPSCRGIWLDRGELDKIIERSMAQDSQSSNQNNNDYNRSHKEHYKENYQSKKKSFLSDIFDF